MRSNQVLGQCVFQHLVSEITGILTNETKEKNRWKSHMNAFGVFYRTFKEAVENAVGFPPNGKQGAFSIIKDTNFTWAVKAHA